MRSLSLRLIILAGAWMILGSATSVHNSKTSAVKQAHYYFYWSDTDTFLEYSTTAQAETDLTNLTGRQVDTNSSSGTLVAYGYTNSTQPHNTWPAVSLYEH
jgi:hypothetical protein